MKRLLLPSFAVLLNGCSSLTLSGYQRPVLSYPPAWQQHTSGTAYLRDSGQWWRQFNDPMLSSNIERALISNNDLILAGMRLKQALLDVKLSNGTLTPDVSASGSASNAKSLKTGDPSSERYSASLSLSYELDLWGKLASTRSQAQWSANATAQDLQNTARLLIGSVAGLHWRLAQYNQKIRQLQEIQRLNEQVLKLTESQYQAGKIGQEDVLQAEQTIVNQRLQLASLQTEREKARHALAILLDLPAGTAVPESTTTKEVSPLTISLSQPLAIIARRPDVQAAEWRLRAALAGSDVARLNFYPTLSLQAVLDTGASVFSQWFSSPSRTLGTQLGLPFLQWNTVQATVGRSALDVQQAAITFRNSVNSALSEVADANVERESLWKQYQTLQRNQSIDTRRSAIARSKYQAGEQSLTYLLNAMAQEFNNEINLTQAGYQYLNATLTLCLAMGYGNT